MTIGVLVVAVWFAVVAVMLVRQYLTNAFAVEAPVVEPRMVDAGEWAPVVCAVAASAA